MPIDSIPLTEYASRRKKLLTALKGAAGLVFAGEHDAHLPEAYRPHPNFEYFTGVIDEPGAILLLDPSNPVESRRAALLLAPLNPEVEKWDGYRLEISKELRDRSGFAFVQRTNMLGRLLLAAARRSPRLACLHPLAQHDQPVTPDLEIFKRVAERVPGVTIEDHTEVPARMRAVKSRNEIAMIRRAVAITTKGFEAMLATVRPGINEFQVQEAIEHAYRSNGAREVAFPAICGSGLNSTVLHYRANDSDIAAGDLICVDSGASYQGYAADVTRTVPVDGTFTERQREVYEIVLKAERAAIRATKPGATFAEIDKAARDIIVRAGYGDYFIHSIGHHLGLETHDITPDAPIRDGAVITIEPGIYIPEERLGIRIEDDVVATKAGPKVLSNKIPKTVAEIERAMARTSQG